MVSGGAILSGMPPRTNSATVNPKGGIPVTSSAIVTLLGRLKRVRLSNDLAVFSVPSAESGRRSQIQRTPTPTTTRR